LRLFPPRHPCAEGGRLRQLPWAGRPDAADVEGGAADDGVVPRMPPPARAPPPAAPGGVQHGLEARARPARAGPGTGPGLPRPGRSPPRLLDVPPMTISARKTAGLGLDLAAIRARLAGAGGPRYWRSLEELAETAEFRAFLEAEFPSWARECADASSRRRFLSPMGPSLALAGVGGRSGAANEKMVPCGGPPEEIVPGEPLRFATAVVLGGFATGVLVESHMGRPTMVEGNDRHPDSLGAIDPLAQASLLTLY